MADTLKDVFHRNTVGRLPDSLPRELDMALRPYRAHLDYEVGQLRQRSPGIVKDVYVDLIDSRELNAAAFVLGKKEFVGINAGFAVALPFFYLSVLSHPQAFPTIGDPSAERPVAHGVDRDMLFLSGRGSDFRPGVNWRPVMSPPIDEARFNYASYLSTLAWDFLLFHEIGHIIRCHLAYLHEAGFRASTDSRARMLHEFGEPGAADEWTLRRMLESDADSIAARVQVDGHSHNEPAVLARVAFGGKCSADLNWTWEDVCLTWYRSVLLLFQLMAILDTDDVSKSTRTHPHPDVRLHIVANEAWQPWRKFIQSEDAYRRIAQTVKLEIDTLLVEGVLPSSVARSRSSYSADFRQASSGLQTDLAATRPRLNELTRQRLGTDSGSTSE